jgi:hypothetical protein
MRVNDFPRHDFGDRFALVSKLIPTYKENGSDGRLPILEQRGSLPSD